MLELELNRILIITGGRIEEDFLSEIVHKHRYSRIIAADHGLETADRLQLPLDYIVGDFDSTPKQLLKKYEKTSSKIKTFPTEKDKTDTQLAIELALMHKPGIIDVVGATGSRLDHTLANLHLLLQPMRHGVEVFLLDRNNKIYLKQDSFTITKSEQYGDYVSFLPFTSEVSGVTLTGFKYPLENMTMSAGNSLGISNEIQSEIAEVTIKKGVLVVFQVKD